MNDLPFSTRLWFAWVCFFRVLLDGSFAQRAFSVRDRMPTPPPLPPAPEPAAPPAPKVEKVEAPPAPPSTDAALHLLTLFQREGRLVDFLQEDITSHQDGDVGAVARVVHQGCSKVLRAHLTLQPLRSEDEGARVKVEEGYLPQTVKLIGNVSGKPPFQGILRHRGWRATKLSLPTTLPLHDAEVIAPAEIEIP